ncbi:MAG: ice-binding family protein [Pseudomonadota bacterium]|nr:ice-binding family protein [Pseudomonadota bacterium]
MRNVTNQNAGTAEMSVGRAWNMRLATPMLLAVLLAGCTPFDKVDGNEPDPGADTGAAATLPDPKTAVSDAFFVIAPADTGDTYDTDIDGSPTPDTGADTATDTDTAVDTDTGVDTDTAVDTDTDTATDTDTGACITGTPSAIGPELLTAAGFAVLAGSTVTNLGATTLTGDLGLSPGSAITGFPPGLVVGSTHTTDAAALQAQIDHVAAYTDAANRSGATPLPEDISGLSLVPGVYSASSSLQIASANLILDGGGDPNATWIFQIGSTLTTSAGVDVILADCADATNVYWQVGTSATIGTGTDFVGTIMADQSITISSGANVEGRLLASVGAVTLDTNLVTVP